MQSLRKRYINAVPLLALTAVLVGCSSSESGSAEPDDSSQPDASGVPSSSAVSPSPGSETQLSSIDSCSLLTAEELREFGEFEEGVNKIVGSGRVCEWKEVRDSEGRSATLIATIRENGGLDTIEDQGFGLRNGKTNTTGREVKEIPTSIGCVVAVAVNEGQRVEVGTSKLGGGLDKQEACQMAGEVAELIDPKLPLG